MVNEEVGILRGHLCAHNYASGLEKVSIVETGDVVGVILAYSGLHFYLGT